MTKNIVLYVGSFNFKISNASSVRVIENALFIKKNGFDVEVMGVVYNEFLIDDVKVSDITKQDKPFDASIESIKNRYFDLKNSYKNVIIIAYNYPPIVFNRLIKFTKLNKIPLVSDVTEWYCFQGSYNTYNLLRWCLNEWKMRFLLNKCDHFIFATSFLKSRFKNKNTIILPFVTTKKSIDFYEPINDVIIYTYAGSPGINFKKDRLDILFKAFLKLKEKTNNFVFNVIGVEGGFSKDKQIIKIIDLLGDNINFFGRLPHNETIEILKKSDYTVFARDVNKVSKVGFPTKVFEAFKYGIPIITNNTSDLTNYITSKNGFLLSDNKVESFFNVFLKINNNSNLKLLHKKSVVNDNPFAAINFENNFQLFLNNVLKASSNI